MKKIACFSGGKDSTAMLIYLIENNAQVDEILYVNMDKWIWDGASDHVKKVEKALNCKITVLECFDEIKRGFERWGFPSFFNRWCTSIKREKMRKYLKNKYPNDHVVQYVGYTADETKRIGRKLYCYGDAEHPLYDAGITSDETLEMCKKYGFDFDGIYEHHTHYNCWLCPLQKVNELRWIYNNCPEKWEYLERLQRSTPGYYNNGKSIFEFTNRFWKENEENLKEKMMEKRALYNTK